MTSWATIIISIRTLLHGEGTNSGEWAQAVVGKDRKTMELLSVFSFNLWL